jgi:hypothetical protein
VDQKGIDMERRFSPRWSDMAETLRRDRLQETKVTVMLANAFHHPFVVATFLRLVQVKMPGAICLESRYEVPDNSSGNSPGSRHDIVLKVQAKKKVHCFVIEVKLGAGMHDGNFKVSGAYKEHDKVLLCPTEYSIRRTVKGLTRVSLDALLDGLAAVPLPALAGDDPYADSAMLSLLNLLAYWATTRPPDPDSDDIKAFIDVCGDAPKGKYLALNLTGWQHWNQNARLRVVCECDGCARNRKRADWWFNGEEWHHYERRKKFHRDAYWEVHRVMQFLARRARDSESKGCAIDISDTAVALRETRGGKEVVCFEKNNTDWRIKDG